jgi:hypothetical protein
MQITRINPVGATASSVTGYVWNMLPAKSVFKPSGCRRRPDPDRRQHHAGILPAEFEQLHGLPRVRAHRLAQLLTAAGPHGLRKVVKPAAGAAAPYAADYSFLFVSETKR